MTKTIKPWLTLCLVLSPLFNPTAAKCAVPDKSDYVALSSAQMDAVVEPIALYPDVLLKSILPASTFPDQIVDAALLVKSKEDAKRIKDQAWDVSVKTIATYPGVLKMMFEKIDWTTQLGEAFLNQHRQVLDAIQLARLIAKGDGTLKSNSQQEVVVEERSGDTIIQIQPANPEVVYVPTTTVVENDSSSALVPLATFGVGLALGAALADDDDDDHYYYGGGGPAFWYDDSPYNQWMDNRREAWEDHNDRAWDRQDFRQGQREDRQDFRQDNYEQGQRPTQNDWKNQRAAASTERKSAAKVRASSYSKSASSRGWSTQPRSSSYSSRSAFDQSAFQGYGSRSSTSAASSRGYGSRMASSGSRGGGFSGRGGGGGFRGGGGRGGGRR